MVLLKLIHKHLTYKIESPFIANCDIVKNGACRIKTTFMYPDHSNIDLFLEYHLDQYVMSDYGQTILYLYDRQITNPNIEVVENICKDSEVLYRNGSIELDLSNHPSIDISNNIYKLVSACTKVVEFVK